MPRPATPELVALLLLAGLALGCIEGGPGAATSEEAARADSSAAGYDVGTTPSTVTPPVPAADSTRRTGVVASAAAPVTTSQPTPRRDTVTRPARRDSAQRATADTSAAAGGDTAASPPRRPAGAVTVNEFLGFDSRTKTVTLSLVAGYNSINNSLNFNGGIRGNHAVVVPVGWAVLVGVTNRDADLAHSAVVIPYTVPLPAEPPPAPAFPGARLEDAEKGITAGDTMAMFFSAQRPGEYMIVCGVSGHAQGGEWLRLTVSATAAEPAYR